MKNILGFLFKLFIFFIAFSALYFLYYYTPEFVDFFYLYFNLDLDFFINLINFFLGLILICYFLYFLFSNYLLLYFQYGETFIYIVCLILCLILFFL